MSSVMCAMSSAMCKPGFGRSIAIGLGSAGERICWERCDDLYQILFGWTWSTTKCVRQWHAFARFPGGCLWAAGDRNPSAGFWVRGAVTGPLQAPALTTVVDSRITLPRRWMLHFLLSCSSSSSSYPIFTCTHRYCASLPTYSRPCAYNQDSNSNNNCARNTSNEYGSR